MLPFDLRTKEFIGIVVPSPQVSVSSTGTPLGSALSGNTSDTTTPTNYMQIAPILFNVSFDPNMRFKSSLLSSLDSAFSGAISSLKTLGPLAGASPEEIAQNLVSGVSFPFSPIDFTGGGCRYMVHIPELMPFIDSMDGIWCYSGTPSMQANPTKSNEGSLGGLVADPIGKLFALDETIENTIDATVDTLNTLMQTGEIITGDVLGQIESVATTTLFQPFYEIEQYLQTLENVDDAIISAVSSLSSIYTDGQAIIGGVVTDTENFLTSIENLSLMDIDSALVSLENLLTEEGQTELLNSIANIGVDLTQSAFGNLYSAFSSIDLAITSGLNALTELGGWGVDFSIDDVVSNMTSVVGNTVNGALGLVSGGFLNFTLNSGAEMSPQKQDTASGSFSSIKPGQKVLIRFLENDLNSAQIIRLLPHDSSYGPHYGNYKSTSDDLQDLYPSLYNPPSGSSSSDWGFDYQGASPTDGNSESDWGFDYQGASPTDGNSESDWEFNYQGATPRN